MQLHFFNVPLMDGELVARELNQLLNSHRIADVRKELVAVGAHSYWAIFGVLVD